MFLNRLQRTHGKQGSAHTNYLGKGYNAESLWTRMLLKPFLLFGIIATLTLLIGIVRDNLEALEMVRLAGLSGLFGITYFSMRKVGSLKGSMLFFLLFFPPVFALNSFDQTASGIFNQHLFLLTLLPTLAFQVLDRRGAVASLFVLGVVLGGLYSLHRTGTFEFVSRSVADIDSRMGVLAFVSSLSSAMGWVSSSISQRSTEALKTQQERALQSAKMASLGRMADGIAHEINNPLAIISAINHHLRKEIFKSNIPNQDRLLELVKRINRTVERMAKVVLGLRIYSRNSNGDPLQPANLAEIIEATLSLCTEKFITNDCRIEYTSCPKELIVPCRPNQLSQVLLNLLTNAYDASAEADSRRIAVEVQVADNYVDISVIDNGKGVPKELRHMIMDPFFTTKEIGKGSGLGLSMSLGIVKDHGGEIFLDDSTEAQTRFVLRLPKQLETSQEWAC